MGGGDALGGHAVAFARCIAPVKSFDWDSGQISVCYPGYPQPMQGQSEALFAFRRDRDAAHVDGLLLEGQHRRRYLREHHAFILGIPLVAFDRGASPFVVWEGSHQIIRPALLDVLKPHTTQPWRDVDITEAYQSARQQVFDKCTRVELYAQPGEAFIAHRLLLHGMAPWQDNAKAGTTGA